MLSNVKKDVKYWTLQTIAYKIENLKRFKDTDDVMRGALSGRPKKTTTTEAEHIENELSNNPFLPVKLLADNMKYPCRNSEEASKKANFKCAHPCKRPLLTPLHIEQRLAWAHSVERWYQPQWDAVLFFR